MVARRRRLRLWWRRSGAGIRVLLGLVALALVGFFIYLQRPPEELRDFSNNLLIFSLINLTILIIVILLFLIGRNIARLIFDRRKGILGSQLRLRLVVAFVGLTLIPCVLIYFLASGFLNNAMEGWFNKQTDELVDGAMGVARAHYATLEQMVLRTQSATTREISSSSELKKASQAQNLEATAPQILELLREKHELFSLSLYSRQARILARASGLSSEIEDFQEPSIQREVLNRALVSEAFALFEENGASQFVRAYSRILLGSKSYVLVSSMRLNPDLSYSLGQIVEAHNDYRNLSYYKQPLKSSYLLTLAMIAALILFSAIWVGIYLARELMVPIQKLAEGTRLVARGNYDIKIRKVGGDDMGQLIDSFNKMTRDLKQTRSDADHQQRYLQTIVSNLAVGVIALDRVDKISLASDSAVRLLGLEGQLPIVGQSIGEILIDEPWIEVVPKITELVSEIHSSEVRQLDKEVRVATKQGQLHIVITVGPILDGYGNRLGTLLMLDDVTGLSKAQALLAWREVAQRIAHEIKNPLTPIQLSAQRLAKLIAQDTMIEHSKLLRECSQTILENVNSIKRLADAFSKYAKMPVPFRESCDLNQLISDTLTPYAESNSRVVIQFIADSKLPLITVDKEQIRRVIINLLDNAISAIEEGNNPSEHGSTRVVIRTNLLAHQRVIQIEVSDNGPGVAESQRERIFDPYVTGRQGGTGLGLAIVGSIVADHSGKIWVVDNMPRGAKFVVELPLDVKSLGSSPRRIGAG